MRAIGRCAVTLERSAERCINVLLELIKQKVNYVVQEAVVVIKDIFRRYPNRCSSFFILLKVSCIGDRLGVRTGTVDVHDLCKHCCGNRVD